MYILYHFCGVIRYRPFNFILLLTLFYFIILLSLNYYIFSGCGRGEGGRNRNSRGKNLHQKKHVSLPIVLSVPKSNMSVEENNPGAVE